MGEVGVSLSPGVRQTLLDLVQTQQLFDVAQSQLTTGKIVSSAADDPVRYFKSQSLLGRATDFLNSKTNIDQGVSTVDAAVTATTSVASLLKQLQSVLENARGGTLSERVAATQQFKTIGQQLNQLVRDASYQGLNLLSGTSAQLTVQLSLRTGAVIIVNGYNLVATTGYNARALFTIAVPTFNAAGQILFSNLVASTVNGAGTVLGFSALDVTGTSAGTVAASVASAIFTATDNRLSTAISQLSGIAAALGTYVQILQTRSTFSQSYASTLQAGSDKLTLADLNTAAANSQALTLRLQLGVTSIAIQDQLRGAVLSILTASLNGSRLS